MQNSVSEAEIIEYLGREWGNFAKRRWSNISYTGINDQRKLLDEMRPARHPCHWGRMMNNPKYITVAVVAVLFRSLASHLVSGLMTYNRQRSLLLNEAEIVSVSASDIAGMKATAGPPAEPTQGPR